MLTCCAAAAIAADGDATPLTEKEFLARFEKTDARLEVFEARVAEARAEIAGAGARANPSIAYDREEVFADEGLPENFLRLTIPIDVSGRRSRRIEAARSGVEATRAETAAERADLIFDALVVYYDAAYALERTATLQAGRAALAKLVAIVEKRVKAGDASGYDLKRLELELAGYDDLLATAEVDLEAARRRVAILAGDPEGRYDAVDPLDPPALPGPLAQLAEGALASREDYKATRLRRDQAEHDLAAAGRAWIPTLSLTAGLKTSDLGMGETAFGYVAGLAVSIPLFDRGQGDAARAAAAKRRAAAEARVLEQRIPAGVRAAYETLELRIAQVTRIGESQLAKLDELLRGAEVSYREGERPSVFELLDAYRTARDVRLRHLELRHEAKKSEIDLWRALGRRP